MRHFYPLIMNVGTLVFFSVVAFSGGLKATALACYRRAGLQAALARPHLVLGAIMAVALLLRVSLIAANRFHGDEALFAHWGLLIATGKDIFLKTELVDKPPLLFYALGLSFKLFGPSETAARLPNLIASLATIAIVYEMARALFDRRAAALSALFLAFSPFHIQFSPTAFTDPLMVSLALAACLLALKGRFLGAGVLMGLAVMAKHLAVLFLPLLALFAVVAVARQGRRAAWRRAGLELGSGFLAMIGLLAIWDVVIRADTPAFMDVANAHYGGLRLVAPEALWLRLHSWLGVSQYFTGSGLLNRALLGGVPLLLAYSLGRRHKRPGWLFDAMLAGFALYFLAVHTLFNFGLWDRYLLGLAPIVAILLSRVVLLPYDALLQGRRPAGQAAYGLLLGLLLVAALLPPAGVALRHGFPVGGDDGTFQGIDAVANYMRATAPAGSVVFHRWLGWHYSFYMFGLPYSFLYYPTPEYLLEVTQRLPDADKYITFPSWIDDGEVRACLREGGWALREMYRTYRPDGTVSFIVYRIERRAAGPPAGD